MSAFKSYPFFRDIYLVCVSLSMHGGLKTTFKLALAFHHVGLPHRTQVRLGVKDFTQLGGLACFQGEFFWGGRNFSLQANHLHVNLRSGRLHLNKSLEAGS